MTKLMIALTGSAALTAGFVALPAPALAQSNRVSEIIVYGNDPCPRSTDVVVLLWARKPQCDRYRIP
jgi:hypothetical protein